MNTIKEKHFYEAQKYISSSDWKELKKEIDSKIYENREFIISDLLAPQEMVYSRNMLRGKAIELVNEYIEKIDNEHLQEVLRVCIIYDNEERSCIATQISEDVICFSHKDWVRRERMILKYISSFDSIYWQDNIHEDNGGTEGWKNSLESGISI